MTTTATRAPRAATPRQLSLLAQLASERGVEVPAATTFAAASAAITALIATPRPRAARPAAPTSGIDLAPLAQFATRGMVRFGVPGGDTRLKVRIDFPTSGQYAGWAFVKDAAVYGEGRRYGSQRPGAAYRGDIEDALRAIAADPRAALLRYAELTSSCGRCGLPLEDEESVARGVGPVCAAAIGW